MQTGTSPTGIGLGLRSSLLKEVAEGKADSAVRFFEVSPENHMHRGGRIPAVFAQIAEKYPIITHSLAMSLGGVDPFASEYFAELQQFIQRFGGAWHSDHLCFCGLEGRAMHDLLPIPFTEDSAKRTAARIREAQDRLEMPMLIENISYYMQIGVPEMDEAEFIRQVLENADCGLLLDVNNVFVNSLNHKFDPFTWLEKIPLERVRQMHIAGHEPWDETMWIDTHGASVRSEVIAMMAWVVERIGPVPILLERDQNIPPLEVLLEEAKILDQAYQAALGQWQKNQAKIIRLTA